MSIDVLLVTICPSNLKVIDAVDFFIESSPKFHADSDKCVSTE